MSEAVERPSASGKHPPRRWLVVALVVSVSFNLFALGFVAARAMRPHRHRAEHGPFMGPRSLARDGFGPKARPMLDDVMKRHGDEMRQDRKELRRARRAVRDALLREPLDVPVLEQALAGLRARTDGSQARMHQALVELAKTLPLEHRKRLARRAHAFEAMGSGEPPRDNAP